MVLFILIVEKTFLTSTQPGHIKVNKYELNTNSNSDVSGNKINNRIANLLNSTKMKKNFEMGFFTSKISLIFT